LLARLFVTRAKWRLRDFRRVENNVWNFRRALNFVAGKNVKRNVLIKFKRYYFSLLQHSKWKIFSLLYNGYLVFPGGKERPGRDADPSLLLVTWSRMSRAIPLLPLWTVRSVQSFSDCTRVTFIFTYTSTPLWPVRSVQSLSVRTRVTFTFTYTSTPPMARTACTEPT